ncbi:hypothetical protein [Pseudoduganella violaceinigra]|uniref:hypothetical protein n=1 Tax=Pseudoduganella violaceinigra TaxID=246602 RepID=UPI0003F85BFC|nr:hypothetical protein [Pseudoduganella violaceinigra]
MTVSMLAAAVSLAIVTQDQLPLRAAPRESAQAQAVLWQGDALEVRGARGDFLQVYDHRRERAGYVRAARVRQVDLQPAAAPELLAVMRFLRDTPGAEALGIAYGAAYLKAAAPQAIDAEPFDAIGGMAERLAARASSKLAPQAETALAAHLEVVASYGVAMRSYEQDGKVRVCYDGDAFRRVLAAAATAEQRARAALALSHGACIDPALGGGARAEHDRWRAGLLDSVDMARLPEHMKNRIHMRRAAVWSSVAFQRARKGENAAEAAGRAEQALAAVNKAELADEDNAAYAEAGVRVGAVRWALETVPAQGKAAPQLAVTAAPGRPGETCVSLQGGGKALVSRCTWGVAWLASARVHPQGTALALAVQPVDGWREMWLFRRDGEAWKVDVLPPASSDPDVGYAEFAGWVPGSAKMLAAREVRAEGKFRRSFELLDMATLATERGADRPESLSTFYKWQDPAWKRATVSLR